VPEGTENRQGALIAGQPDQFQQPAAQPVVLFTMELSGQLGQVLASVRV